MGQLKLNQVHKSFGAVDVINGVSLDIKHGEFVVFVGPSGCGKSTLLRMIAGLEEISQGDVEIDGKIVNNLPPVKRGIAMVFQSYALYPHMTVFENIAFPLRVERLPQAEVEEKVNQAAKILQLEPRLKHKPGQLSGGQRQRVAIGRAIVREPSIFLFDEPLSNLDAALRADMRVELSKLHDELDATMVYVTHDQIEAMTMADRIVVLDEGIISQVGTPLELYHRPENLFVAGFIGNPRMNHIEVECVSFDDDSVTVKMQDETRIQVPAKPNSNHKGEMMTLGIRAEHIRLAGGDVKIKTRPDVVERLGIHTVVHSSIAGTDLNFSAILSGTPEIAVRKDVDLSFNSKDCHLFDKDGQALERDVALTEIDLDLINTGK